MLDINGLREEKGGDPEKVRESQRRRHKDVQIVDKVIEADVQWRQLQFKVDNLRGDYGKVNKEVAMKKKAGENADELIAKAKEIDAEIKAAEELCNKCMAERDEMLCKIGNIVPDSVPVSDDEDNNAIIRTYALEKVLKTESVPEFKIVKELDAAAQKHEGKLSHVDLIPMLGLADTERGAAIAGKIGARTCACVLVCVLMLVFKGNRGYFLIGDGVLLNQALISYGLAFLCPRGYVPLQTPFFMQKEAMAAVAQVLALSCGRCMK
eukprot:765283-Hanusia_phi.AAC.3